MEAIWKAILGVFISAMIIFSGVAILGANNAAAEAERYLYAVAGEISAANFAEEVRLRKIEEAKGYDYALSVKLSGDAVEDAFYTGYVILTMEYPYDVPLIGLHSVQRKQLIVY